MKRRMAESIRGLRLPRYAEIPTVGLYLEQTIKYINSYLAPLGCLELTGSMDRTRALVTPEGQEIRIDSNQSVFAFVGTIQEETHRFAITFHRQLRSKRLRYSELDNISGIGPRRKEQLLKQFKSLTAIGQATLPELERILPRDAAAAVYQHFHKEENSDAD